MRIEEIFGHKIENTMDHFTFQKSHQKDFIFF